MIPPDRRERIGLAITKSIVEMHGGDIRVESGERRVTFEIRMPRGELRG